MRFVAVVLVFFALVPPEVHATAGPCYATIQQTILATESPGAQPPSVLGRGFRLEFIQVDSFANRGWALVATCQHPDWPLRLVPLAGSSGTNKSSVLNALQSEMIHVGQHVVVVRNDLVSQLTRNGVAQQQGSVGQTIGVRIRALSPETADQFVTGIVIGPDVIEVRE